VDVTAGSLSIIYQRCWESGVVPADWRLDNIIPFYKTGIREDPENYRQVNLTSLPGKIMEKNMLLKGISRTMQPSGTVNMGLQKKRSCVNDLISFYAKVTHPVGEGKVLDVAFLEFFKAF